MARRAGKLRRFILAFVLLGGVLSWKTVPLVSTSCPCSIWSPPATPGQSDSADPSATELGVKFRSDFAGRVSAIRFYKSDLNVGPHTASLFARDGTKLADATFDSETGSGWQQASFASPVAIAAKTTYVAAYHTDSGHYAADDSAFSTVGVDSGPLHALRSGVDGANGVFAHGPDGTFPSSSLNATNFWVDVVLAVDPPIISTLSTTKASVGVTIAINGSHLLGTQSVSFSGTLATFSVPSDVKINATVPDGATSGPITVTTYGGSTQSPAFTVRPKINALSPASAKVGDPVTITGTSFLGTTRVAFAQGKGAPFTVVDDHTVTTIVPGGAVTGKVQLTTPSGTAVSTQTFTVEETPIPPTGFRCTRVLGASQTQQWFQDGGFETYVPNTRWEGQLAGGSAIEFWADPNSTVWNTKITSPCGVGPPDRMMLNVYSKADNADYDTLIRQSVANIFSKYPSVQVVILEPIVGGPHHTLCYYSGKVVAATQGHPVIDAAIDRVKGGNVISGLSPEVGDCSQYMDALGHLAPPGRTYVGAAMGNYYATLDNGGTPTPNPFPSP